MREQTDKSATDLWDKTEKNQQLKPGLKGESTMTTQTADAATGRAARDARVRERPILFSGAMVRAILNGSKTQTRRVVKPQPGPDVTDVIRNGHQFVAAYPNRAAIRPFEFAAACPYGQPGDRLWVREGLERGNYITTEVERTDAVYYRADGDIAWGAVWVWQRDTIPSQFCPRGLSRITLEVTGVRVERVQDISENDAREEGVEVVRYSSAAGPSAPPSALYRELWDSLNASRGYGSDVNPWVWVVEFRALGAA